MDNMRIYNAGRSVPTGAVKKITGGSYGKAGLSDINPQWRIEKMTELFGPCGDGWIWEPVEAWINEGVCFAHVIVKYLLPDGEYSHPVHGYGGTVMGRMGDDDVYKSTFTDAVSNALRYLGIGADVWYKPGNTAEQNQFDTKYSAPPAQGKKKPETSALATPEQLKIIKDIYPADRIDAILKFYRVSDTAALTKGEAEVVIKKRQREIEKEEMKQRAQMEGAYNESLNGG